MPDFVLLKHSIAEARLDGFSTFGTTASTAPLAPLVEVHTDIQRSAAIALNSQPDVVAFARVMPTRLIEPFSIEALESEGAAPRA